MSPAQSFQHPILVLVLLAAAGVLVFGIWRGRPDLGKRAFMGVILTSVVVSLVAGFIPFLPVPPRNQIIYLVTGGTAVIHLISAVPLLVAGNWFQTIKAATETQKSRSVSC
ncbi:hypothetical protein GCM10008955_37770 [Deinococcus malanensis]|uniref:Uncharacterized protein n=1 Tax=Deinococcus malanensis TaxID=1706855 RepID=A0ABQ2F143_9DEIO|nr:hypothetical protein [Deinococcus malanensis]GGK40431.1 hypothetical protein GCM10008955_37770 [Deinococcus malanensis]